MSRKDVACVIDGCEQSQIARGWCIKHYQRWRTYGDPNAQVKFKAQSLEEQFEHYTERRGECLEWTGTRRNGYGRIKVQNLNKTAHRVAFERAHGVIPEGLEVDHLCHNLSCVKIEHLRLATRPQNMENKRGAYRNNKTGVRGVHVDGRSGMYRAQVYKDKKLVYAESFASLDQAAQAVRAKRLEIYTFNVLDRAA